MFSKFRDFDFYRSIPKDLTETNNVSSALSVCAAIFMLVLFIAEFWAFLTLNIQTNIVIDPNTDSLLRINFNITLLDMPCEYAVIDVVDILGTRNDNVTVNVNKWQVDENGIRRGYEGRNPTQLDLMHDNNLDHKMLTDNGIHAPMIGEHDFEPWLSNHEYVFVDFFAPWCIWCQRLHPVWEALAEEVERQSLPISIIQVDCVESRDLCFQQKIQAFPMMRLFKHGQPQPPDYRSDRTVEAFMTFLHDRLSHDEQFALMKPEEKLAHEERKQANRDDHPGCMLSGFLLVNRVPGNFHIEMRSKHHNINPPLANLSHVVNHLSFGPVLPKTAVRRLSIIPPKYFNFNSTQPMNDRMYLNTKLHQVFHHYVKVVSTNVDLGGRDSILAYQMVQSSQIMSFDESDIPDARFSYDLSPMSVIISRKGKHLYEFLTSMCAIIGGTFTVLGLVSGALSVLFKPKKI
eukprot:gene4183-4478_t